MGPAAETILEPQDCHRLAEAFRLANSIRASVWPGWQFTRFPVLLVTTEREFLVGATQPIDDLEPVGYSLELQCEVFSRPRCFDVGVTAAFPAFGQDPVVVIGVAEAVQKSSTAWVLTVLHEHFHQYQMSDPDYFSAAANLGLSGRDETGMWMLTYPFPYESSEVSEGYAVLSAELQRALTMSSDDERRSLWATYNAFLIGLSNADRRYLSFQVWQEGVARYVELRAAEAASQHYNPSTEFQRLPDAQPFSSVAQDMRRRLVAQLGQPDLPQNRREAFYALGAGLALLLDQESLAWKSRYLREKFSIERCIVSNEVN